MNPRPTDIHPKTELYAQWKRYGHHLEEYACEFGGTAFLVFCLVSIVGLMFGRLSPVPHLIPSASLRLFLAGLLIGGSGGLVAISPPGKLSGAHLNPAVSLGFCVLNKMHVKDTVGYVVSQMAGGVAGAWLARAMLGPWARSVQDGVLAPGVSVSPGAAFFAELAATFVLTWLIFAFVSHERLMRWTPFAVMLAAGVLVCLDGHVSGAGMNPARWFGPAWVTNFWSLVPAYLLAPLLGGFLAARLRQARFLHKALPATGKLYHDIRYRSLFKHDIVATTPPPHVLQ